MDAAHDLDVDSLLLLVVGAHLRAELDDRPLAYRLRDRIAGWVDTSLDNSDDTPKIVPIVCTDVWFLNNQELLARPAISIGEPGVNAATAYLSNRLPTALVVDHALRIHLDPEFAELHACLWGVNAQTTAIAVDMFVERYLEAFLQEAA